MQVQIVINTGNAAFEDNPLAEVARILRELAKHIEGHPHFSPGYEQALHDINGNEAGYCAVEESG